MNSKELFEIIEEIKRIEGIDLTELAKRAGVDRPYLSTLINNDDAKPIKDKSVLLRKLKKKFGKYFPANGTNETNVKINEHKDTRALIVALQDDKKFLKELILTNLTDLNKQIDNNRELLVSILNGMVARGETIMGSLEKLTKLKPGSLVEESDRRELNLQEKSNQKDRKGGRGSDDKK